MLLPHKPRICHTHQVLREGACLVCADESAGAECFNDVKLLNEHVVLTHALSYDE